MAVAIATAGPAPLNVAVLLAALGVLVLGTGPYSLWRPENRFVGTAS